MEKDNKNNIKKYIPNIISTLRIMSVIPICLLCATLKYPLATLIFGIASASDFVDGYLARKWHVESKYGKYADAFGDKILVIPTIITHLINTFSFNLQSLLISGMFLYEGAIGVTNVISKVIKKNDVSSSIIGKIKTAFLMSTLFLSMCTTFINNPTFNLIANTIAPLITIALQSISLKDYMKKANKTNFQEEDSTNTIQIGNEDIKNLSNSKELIKDSMGRKDVIEKLKEEKNNLLTKNEESKTKKIGQKNFKVDKNKGTK